MKRPYRIHRSSKFLCIKGNRDNHSFHLIDRKDYPVNWKGCALWRCSYCNKIVESM